MGVGVGLLFASRLVWVVFPRSSSNRDAVTALNRALWADPAAAFPGPFGELLPWRRHGTPPARPRFPDLPQIRDLRICLTEPGAAGRSPPCAALSRRKRELGRDPQLELAGREHLGLWPPCLTSTCPQDSQAGDRTPPFPTRANSQRFGASRPKSGAPCPGHRLTAVLPVKRRAWDRGRDRPFPSDS